MHGSGYGNGCPKMWYMRLKGNGDAGGVSTTLWQWRLQESGDVGCACRVCGDCGGGDDVGCGFCCGWNGWVQPREVACEAPELALKVLPLGVAAVAVVVERWMMAGQSEWLVTWRVAWRLW